MHPENWKKVKELLNEVLELETSKRQHFLSNSDVSPEIISEVESLLDFETAAEEAMRLSAIEFSKDFFDREGENSFLGQNFGAYRTVRELGYGGMGAVYLAELHRRKVIAALTIIINRTK